MAFFFVSSPTNERTRCRYAGGISLHGKWRTGTSARNFEKYEISVSQNTSYVVSLKFAENSAFERWPLRHPLAVRRFGESETPGKFYIDLFLSCVIRDISYFLFDMVSMFFFSKCIFLHCRYNLKYDAFYYENKMVDFDK